MQVGDDGGVDLRELGIVHKEPCLPRPADGSSLDGSFLRVRGGEPGLQRHAVGPHEGFGEVVLLQSRQRRRPDDGFGLGAEQPAGQEHPATLLGQQPRVGHTVGHIAGLERRAAEQPGHRKGGGTGIQKDEVLRLDEGSCRLCDALFLVHGQRFLGGHGGFVGAEGAVRQRGSAVDFVQLAQFVQLVQIAPDGGLAGAQRLAQLLHGGSALAGQQVKDEGEAFFCQHEERSLLWCFVIELEAL